MMLFAQGVGFRPIVFERFERDEVEKARTGLFLVVEKINQKIVNLCLLNIGWLLSKDMFENNDMVAVKCKYSESCILPCEEQDSGCSEIGSYKKCELYEIMVYMKAEYEKIGVYDMFVD